MEYAKIEFIGKSGDILHRRNVGGSALRLLLLGTVDGCVCRAVDHMGESLAPQKSFDLAGIGQIEAVDIHSYGFNLGNDGGKCHQLTTQLAFASCNQNSHSFVLTLENGFTTCKISKKSSQRQTGFAPAPRPPAEAPIRINSGNTANRPPVNLCHRECV